MRKKTYYLLAAGLLILATGCYAISVYYNVELATRAAGYSSALPFDPMNYFEKVKRWQQWFSLISYLSALLFLFQNRNAIWRGLRDYCLFTVALFAIALLIKAIWSHMYSGLAIELTFFLWYWPRRPLLYLLLLGCQLLGRRFLRTVRPGAEQAGGTVDGE